MIPAAKRTNLGYVIAQIIPTSNPRIRVKVIKTPNPYLRELERVHAAAIETIIKRTDKMIIAELLTNIFWNVEEFIAHAQMSTLLSN